MSRCTANYIDCNQCFAYNCYADDDDADLDDGAQQQQNMDELDNQVAEWIAKLGECQESGTQHASGTYGDEVELAVFLDDECSIYTSEYTFNSVYNPDYDANEINYVIYAENYIKSAFEVDALSSMAIDVVLQLAFQELSLKEKLGLNLFATRSKSADDGNVQSESLDSANSKASIQTDMNTDLEGGLEHFAQ